MTLFFDGLFRSILLNFQTYGYFKVFFLFFYLVNIYHDQKEYSDFNPSKFVENCFMFQIWLILINHPCAFDKILSSRVIGYSVLYIFN